MIVFGVGMIWVAASAALVTTTTYDGSGALTDGANYDNGAPSNANPGLISVTDNTWAGNVWADFAARQTNGYADVESEGNLAMRSRSFRDVAQLITFRCARDSSFSSNVVRCEEWIIFELKVDVAQSCAMYRGFELGMAMAVCVARIFFFEVPHPPNHS